MRFLQQAGLRPPREILPKYSQDGSTCAANAWLREPNGMPLSGRGGTCATLLFNLATTMVFCRSVNEMIAFYHR